MTYTAADKLCLDGMRLIQTDANGSTTGIAQTNDAAGGVSGTYLREYRTEKDNYSRIRAYGYANGDTTGASGPAYFKVWTKSGQIYEYGASPASDANSQSLINAQGKTAVAAWAVTRVSDTVSNYMDFKYTQRDVAWGSGTVAGTPGNGHEWNVKEIQYTGHGAQLPSNKVVFNYSDRPDATDRAETYHQGSKNVSIARLTSIETYINSANPGQLGPAASAVKVKTVNLTYSRGTRTGRSRVATIQECSGINATRCLPAALFTYSDGGSEAYVTTSSFNLGSKAILTGAGTSGVLTGDFNGDGKTDLLIWSDTPSQNQLWLSNGDGSFTQSATFNITTENLFKSDGCYSSMVADFNGDGLPDILRYSDSLKPDGIGTCATFGAKILYTNNGDGTFTPHTITGPNLSKRLSKSQTNCITPPATVAVAGTCLEPGDWLGWTQGSNYYLIDVDGDGILDIVTSILPGQLPQQTGKPPASANQCLTSVCTQVWKGAGNGNFTLMTTNVGNKSLYSPPRTYDDRGGRITTVVDIDGDDLADILAVPNQYFEAAVAYRSQGNGSFDPITAATPCTYALDYNGDGRFDCIVPDTLIAGGIPANTLQTSSGLPVMSNAAGFNLTGVGYELWGWNAGLNVPNVGIAIVDFNGDGRHDILRWGDDTTKNALYLSNGDGTFAPSQTFSLGTRNQLRRSDGTYDFVLGDFRGLGQTDILSLSSVAGQGNALLIKQDAMPPDQLLSVKTPMAITTQLNWRSIGNSNVVFSAAGTATTSNDIRYLSDLGSGNASVYPTIDMTMPMLVVTTSTRDSGVGTQTVSTDYSYAGLKADRRGRGLLGFRQWRQQSPAAQGAPLTVVTDFVQPYPYTGVAWQTASYLGTNAITTNSALTAPLLSKSLNTYCDQTVASTSAQVAALTPQPTPSVPCPVLAKVVRPYLYQSVESGFDIDGTTLPTVTTLNSLNGSGDPLQVNVTTTLAAAGALPAQTFTKNTTNTYYADNTAGDAWILGRLQTAQVSSSVPNLLAGLTVSAGTAPMASAVTGTSSPLSVVASPASVTASSSTAGIVTGSTTATVQSSSSATLPLSYSWSGCPAGVSVSPASGSNLNANSIAASFSANLAAGASVNGSCNLSVTDAAGRVGAVNVPVALSVSTPALSAISFSPSAPSFIASAPGQASVSTTAYYGGGVAPYTLTWTRVGNGTQISVPSNSGPTSLTSASTSFSANVAWASSVTEQFQLRVTDSANQSVQATVTVTLGCVAQALTASITPSPLGISSGTNGGTASGTAAASGSGGVGPYTYSWSPASSNGISVSNTGVANPTFSSVVSYGSSASATFTVTVNDNANHSATSTLTVTASGPPPPTLTVSLTAPTWPLQSTASGATMSGTVTAAAAGGVGPYTYSWSSVSGAGIGISGTTGATVTLSAAPTWGVNFNQTYRVTSTDSQGHTATADTAAAIYGPPYPPVPTVTTTPASPISRNYAGPGTYSFTITANPSGGATPYSYAWTDLYGSGYTLTNANTATVTVSFSILACDNKSGTVRLTLGDAAGRSVTSDVVLNILSKNNGKLCP